MLERHSNGFVVAECDLELRGSGELLGTRQSGRGLRTSFKVGPCWGQLFCGPAVGRWARLVNMCMLMWTCPLHSCWKTKPSSASQHRHCTHFHTPFSPPPHTHPSPAQAATIPGDRALLDEARRAASRLLAQQPDPRQWRPELAGLVASDSLLELDTVTLPSLG